MTQICYLYPSQEVINYLKETYITIETIMMEIEPPQVKDTPHQRAVINVQNAARVQEMQAAISNRTQELHILPELVPNVLGIWNMQRMKYGRDPIRIRNIENLTNIPPKSTTTNNQRKIES
ncbi:hypothetical protein PGTUg99_005596 [Puccinia graminis f. sp. tritici]|uniref:Uncharacterized protein n=2 Tax=Puccinia graminis f. sp. tritici TaxID=56615 RepID=A0A5B0QKV9_PUCGR|nr:hypothetical protein PGTUg99_005596 [Puccinia graminis f. sp. tritici]